MHLRQASGPVLSFERGDGDSAMLCVFNLGHSPEAWSLPAGWRVVEAVNVSDAGSGTLPSLAGLLLAKPP